MDELGYEEYLIIEGEEIAIPRTITPPSVTNRDPVMQHFAYSHLPGNLRYVVSFIYEAAERLHSEIPPTVERAKALDKLLDARDAAIRAAQTFTPIT